MTTENKNTQQHSAFQKNWIYGLLALMASIFGYFWMNSDTEIATPKENTELAAQEEPTEKASEVRAEPETTASVVEEAPAAPPKPVDQPPKPKKKAKATKPNVALKEPAPMKYNPADFKPNPFYENMPASRTALSPAIMKSPTDNALILPDSKGDYRFQLAVELSAEKDDRIAVFPNNKAAYDAEKPLWRIVFPDTHSGLWKQFIKLDGKPGLYYVVLNSGGEARVLGKFVLN